LPAELLISIFVKLNSTKDLRSCMLVSYHWAVNCVGILWHRPQCSKWDNLINVTTSLSKNPFFPYHQMIRRLNLATLQKRVSDGTIQPFIQCKRIERMTLTSCSGLTDQAVSSLVNGNTHLQALDVSDIRALTDQTLYTVAENCPRLQGLNVMNCSNITDESLVAVAQNCRQIKRVSLVATSAHLPCALPLIIALAEIKQPPLGHRRIHNCFCGKLHIDPRNRSAVLLASHLRVGDCVVGSSLPSSRTSPCPMFGDLRQRIPEPTTKAEL
jgi:hypothetical protein